MAVDVVTRVRRSLAELLTLPAQAQPANAPRRSDLPWRPIVVQASAIWLVTRIAYAALTYYAVLFSSGSRTLNRVSVPIQTLAQSWLHWDAYWYLRIADQGYYGPQPTAFFPLYPALIRLVTLVIGSNHDLAAALLISNLGTLGAFIGIALLAANEAGNDAAAWRTLRVFVAYPLAFFLAAPYTEGIFVAFAAGSLLCARRGSWRGAAGWALLAGLTRPTALALVLPLVWEYGRQHDWWQRATWQGAGARAALKPGRLAEALLVIGAVPVAIAGFMVFCWVRFGDPIMFLRAERIYWYHEKALPWTGLIQGVRNFIRAPAFSDLQAALLYNLAPLLVFGVLAIVGARILPLMLTLYSFGVIYLSVASPLGGTFDVLGSVGRYLIIATPVFLLLGRWTERRPWLDMLLVSGGFLVQAILALVYLRNGFAT